MKFFPLIWAQLWRKRARTIFTLLSLVAAFLLLGLLQAADAVFSAGVQNPSAYILISQARVSFTSPLPMRLLPRLEAVPGVVAVSHSQFFGGIYKDPRNFFPEFAVNPERWLKVFQECKLPDEQFKAWQTTRTGAIAGKQIVERFGWKLGDKIPLQSQIWPLKDGTRNWTFDLVGILDDRTTDSCVRKNNMYIRYDYFDEARQYGQGLAGLFALRIADPGKAESVAQQIDAMFENSADETKTQTEKEFSLNFVRQLGNLSLIFNGILGAVFFTILLLTYNTMTQTVRERIPEIAVMKTLGFTDGSMLGLVMVESLLMCVIGGLAGMGLAASFMKALPRLPLATPFPPLVANATVWIIAAASMLALGVLVGVLPAWRAKRLSIIDALGGR